MNVLDLDSRLDYLEGVIFTNILQAAFCMKVFSESFMCSQFVCNFLAKEY